MPESFLFPPGASRIDPLPPAPRNAPSQGTPLGGTLPSGASSVVLSSDSIPGFTVPLQDKNNWCWAAVSVGVSTWYGGTSWTQCAVAQAALGLDCATPLPSGCDVPWYLDRALDRVVHFDRYVGTPQPYSDVQAEVHARRPLCCRIQWSVGGHFVAISGWSIDGKGTEFIEVEDPDNGYNFQTLSDFSTAYRSAGSWSDTYYTRSSGSPGTGAGAAPLVTPTS